MKKRAFTFVELLVVMAVIALLAAIPVLAFRSPRDNARKVVCRNYVRQQCLGTMIYAEENDGRVPDLGVGYWLWDVSFRCTNQIREASGVDYRMYDCPGNPAKRSDDARYWQYGWVFSWGVPLLSPLQLRDESILTVAQQKSLFRVLPYVYMFDRLANGTSMLPQTLRTGERAAWIRSLADLQNADTTLMIMDAVISDRNNWNFSDIRTGGAYPSFGIPDSTNHLSHRRIIQDQHVGIEPQGANVGFADGHVAWRSFSVMQHQLDWGQWWWW